MQGTTPRLVYKWFLLIYKISYFVGIFGYLTMMATFLGFNLIFNVKPSTWMDLGLLCMFYALYYGVMARDFAEICTEKMASNIGYYKSEGIPERHLETDICAGKWWRHRDGNVDRCVTARWGRNHCNLLFCSSLC